MSTTDINRRDLFRGALRPVKGVNLPPWVSPTSLARCDGCNDCVTACPEDILKLDDRGHPVVDFSNTGCTFCGDCANACPQDVFLHTSEPAWEVQLVVSDKCLLENGISCQLCTDFCDYDALSFDLSCRPVGALKVEQDSCTGCGMCIGACPVAALSLKPTGKRKAA
ncbi:ferredoxin-type protein NapF [Roseovarius sp. EL26]|uniref:ferredoxin-type protein NapF n=1 Tax=Roseovarius sp. EL26 TaxID=2126672 RepID=UPI0013C4FA63